MAARQPFERNTMNHLKMNDLKWLNPFVWWRRRLRKIDMNVLLPAIEKRASGDKGKIARAFALHISRDPAWNVESWELTNREIDLLMGISYWFEK